MTVIDTTVTEERRAALWHRAERIRVGVDTVRAARAALARERTTAPD